MGFGTQYPHLLQCQPVAFPDSKRPHSHSSTIQSRKLDRALPQRIGVLDVRVIMAFASVSASTIVTSSSNDAQSSREAEAYAR